MTRTLALILTLAAASPALASSYDKIDDATRAKITATLTEQGYEVRKIDSEDGLIEVYALKDGQRFELYLDADLKIVRTKTED